MAELFASGRIVDLILALTALEAAALLVWRRWKGSGPSAAGLVCNLASGACLMLALRAGLTGADWRLVAACLIGALCAHLMDLIIRFRSGLRRSNAAPSRSTTRGTLIKTVAFDQRPQTGSVSI